MRRTVFGCVFLVLLMAGTGRARAGVVISQVYGGGGNSGATFTNDFIELFNPTNATISLIGFSVQYASTTGTTWQTTVIQAGSLQSGQYFLIQEAQGPGGTTSLPTPDLMGTIDLSATAGKVALVNHSTALVGSPPAGGGIQDLVGYGTGTDFFEGAGPAPAPSNTTAAIRLMGGLTDTDNNNADFLASSPNPRNTSSTFNPPSPPPPVTTPEPSALVLTSLGLIGLLTAARLRRRHSASPVS